MRIQEQIEDLDAEMYVQSHTFSAARWLLPDFQTSHFVSRKSLEKISKNVSLKSINQRNRKSNFESTIVVRGICTLTFWGDSALLRR